MIGGIVEVEVGREVFGIGVGFMRIRVAGVTEASRVDWDEFEALVASGCTSMYTRERFIDVAS
jgi:hypothetical protein